MSEYEKAVDRWLVKYFYGSEAGKNQCEERKLARTLVDALEAARITPTIATSVEAPNYFALGVREHADALRAACDDFDDPEDSGHQRLVDACREIVAGDQHWQKRLLDTAIWEVFHVEPAFTLENISPTWHVGAKGTMANDEGRLPWIEISHRDSGKIFNAYMPIILLGEMALEDFGRTILAEVLDADLKETLLQLDDQERFEAEWVHQGQSLPLRFMRKA